MRGTASLYIPLTSEDESLSILSKPLRIRRFLGRWLYLFLALCVVFLILEVAFLAPHSPLNKFRYWTSHVQVQNEHSPFQPLLGTEESPTKLWFPPKGNDFRPHVAPYNTPPPTEERLRTPLFVGFTRNSEMLQQTVLSYIAAGWPREDIIIVDNSGTLDANNEGILSRDNPFFLDYNLFRSRYGVSILQTPTLLSFAQLMNFYLRISIAQQWQFFFWSHMDIAVLSDETSTPYKSFHRRVLDILDEAGLSKRDGSGTEGRKVKNTWAIKFFSYDWLTLVNVEAWRTIGQWDTFIPYYGGDCDAYSRVVMNGFTRDDADAGRIFDLADFIADPESKFFPSTTHPTEDTGSSNSGDNSTHMDLQSIRYQNLINELEKLASDKQTSDRNTWQNAKKGGRGEQWTYDPEGFQKMWWYTADMGRALYEKKWGQPDCGLEEKGVLQSDWWKSEDHPPEGSEDHPPEETEEQPSEEDPS